MIGQRKPRKKCPILVIWTAMRARLPLWACLYVYPYVLFFLLRKTLLVPLLSVSLWKLISCKVVWGRALLLTTGEVARIRYSHRHGLTSTSDQGTKILLQVTAGRGHLKWVGDNRDCSSVLRNWAFFNPRETSWDRELPIGPSNPPMIWFSLWKNKT